MAASATSKCKVWHSLAFPRFALFTLFTIPICSAFAQNTGGVFGPEVTPGSSAFEGRVAIAPGSDGRDRRFASRVHYQKAISDNLRLRAVVQGVDTQANGFEFAFVQLEAQLQFREDEIHGWDSAVRFDAQFADGGADLIGINWTSDIFLNDRWKLRGILMGAVQVGSERRSGAFLQTRSSISYKLDSNYQVQLQMFNNYGSSADFADFRDQNHAVGPAVSGKLGKDWSFEASALFGVTDAATDTDLRIFLTKAF